MKKITAVFFDLGNVLVDFDWNEVFANLRPYLQSPDTVQMEKIFSHAYRYDYETGRIGTNPFFEWLKKELTFEGTTERLIRLWSDIFTPMNERIHLLPELKSRYHLGMISNTCEVHFEWLYARHDFFQWFEHITLSYQVGCMKPHPEIYHHATQTMRVKPEESLFIDDIAENIEGAKRLGWNTLWLLPEQSLQQALYTMKLLP